MNQTSFVRGQVQNIGYQRIFHGFSKFTTIFMEDKIQISDTRGGNRIQGSEGVEKGSKGVLENQSFWQRLNSFVKLKCLALHLLSKYFQTTRQKTTFCVKLLIISDISVFSRKGKYNFLLRVFKSLHKVSSNSIFLSLFFEFYIWRLNDPKDWK